MNYICPVCGFDQLDEPAYDEYDDGSFDICLCCRFKFGYTDHVEISDGVFMEREQTHIMHREKWLQSGAKIFYPEHYPQEFQLNEKVTKEHLITQLKNINITLDSD